MTARRRTVKLGAEPGIRDIDPLYRKLRENVEHEAPIVIDASKVARCDGAVLQLLVSFVAARGARNQTVEWKKPSDAFVDLVVLSDMQSSMGSQWDAGKPG